MMFNLDKWEFDEEQTDELPSLNDIDPQRFIALKNLRNKIIDTLQNRELTVAERLVSMLSLAEPYIIEKNTDDISFIDVFNNPELINPEWEEKVKNYKFKQIENNVFNENTAIYFIYKYLLSSVFEGVEQTSAAVKMAVVGVLINTYFGGDAWTLHLWSKETEHSQYNMDRYKRLLLEAKCLSVSELKRMINANY